METTKTRGATRKPTTEFKKFRNPQGEVLLQACGVQQTTCARVARAHRATKDKRTTLVTEKDIVDNCGRAKKETPHQRDKPRKMRKSCWGAPRDHTEDKHSGGRE